MDIAIDLSEEVKANSSEILSLCYDDIIDIDGNYMIACLDKEWGIIDKNNKIVCEFKPNRIEKCGESLFRVVNNCYTQISRKTFLEGLESYTNVVDCGNIVLARKWTWGVIDSNGEEILPFIYRYLKLNKDKPNEYELYANYNGNRIIIKIDKNTLKADKLDQIDIEGTDVSFIGVDIVGDKYNFKLKYDISYRYNRVTYGNYDKLMFITQYRKLGIINTWKNGYAGMVSLDGTVLVDNTKYSEVEALGYNNIFIVKTKDKLGIYRAGIGETVKTVFSSTVIEPNLGIVYLYRKYKAKGDWWILGNSGRAYRNVTDAFDVSKTDDENIYNIRIYGRNYRVDKNLKLV